MIAKKTTLKEIGEMLAYVVEHVAIKEELNAFRDEFKAFRKETAENSRAIRVEIADIRRQLEELQTRVKQAGPGGSAEELRSGRHDAGAPA